MIITKDVQILPAVAEGRQDVAKDLAAVEVLGVHQDHPVDGVHMGNVVHEIPSTQVHCDLSIRRALFEHPVIWQIWD